MTKTITLTGRVIHPGRGEGRALVSPAPIGFLGGVDPDTGIVLEPGHPIQGRSIAGSVLVFPTGKGSTVGSYTILRLARGGSGPVAMINAESEAIVAVGAIIADIPMIDQVDISAIQDGDWVRIDGDQITIQPGKEMAELVFLKLGGSLLTDKTVPQALRSNVLTRLASEIAAVHHARPDLRLLIGHGSGSFGHVAASRCGTRDGVTSPDGWRGYGETAVAAARLNWHVIDALEEAGLPVLPVQPSASAHAHDGELATLETRPISAALANGLIPVLYGDVALDDVRGGTIISTEQIFRWLAPFFALQRVLLVGEVPGVLSTKPDDPASGKLPEVIKHIAPEDLPELQNTLGGSRGVDVTGGMLAKVAEMVALMSVNPTLLAVQVFSGLTAGLLQAVLLDPNLRAGTRISQRRD